MGEGTTIITDLKVDGAVKSDSTVATLRLMQIVSAGSPTGAFSYSQGLEWAVEAGWVSDEGTFEQWLLEQLQGTVTWQDLPLLKRLYLAVQGNDAEQLQYWSRMSLAMRETAELRDEERQRGRAMRSLIHSLESTDTGGKESDVCRNENVCQLGSFAVYCAKELISLELAMQGYAFSWLENQVTAGVKLVPLGQTAGQQILYRHAALIDQCIENALHVTDDDIGYSSPALAMASSQHETQYCRLYRS